MAKKSETSKKSARSKSGDSNEAKYVWSLTFTAHICDDYETDEFLYSSEEKAKEAMERLIPELVGEGTTVEHVDPLHVLCDGGANEGGCSVSIDKVRVDWR